VSLCCNARPPKERGASLCIIMRIPEEVVVHAPCTPRLDRRRLAAVGSSALVLPVGGS
jgi:hypothetical protein